MRNLEVLLHYQKKTGMGLQTILDMRNEPHVHVYCSDCQNTSYHSMEIEDDLNEYLQWLEGIISEWLEDEEWLRQFHKKYKDANTKIK